MRAGDVVGGDGVIGSGGKFCGEGVGRDVN